MKSYFSAAALCLAMAGGAAAQTAGKQGEGFKGAGMGEHSPTQQMESGGSTTGMSSGAEMTQADCDAVWMKANPSNATTITEMEAQQYVSDVATANPDKDGTLDKMEFTEACERGLVKQ